MNIEVCKETKKGSMSGTMNFPTVVQKLIENGLEAYHVDLVKKENTYYMPNGETHCEKFECSDLDVSGKFESAEVVLAIRDAQASKIKYVEFLRRISKAGCNYYIVYLRGKKVIYFARNGDFHEEYFPNK